MRHSLSVLSLALSIAIPVSAESVLVLPVPGATDTPRERLNLSIVIPSKLTPKPEEPQRERIRSSALSVVDWQPFKYTPQKRFVFDTLKLLKKKGLAVRLYDRDVIEYEVHDWAPMGPVIVRLWEKLLDIYRKDALKKFGLVASDLERFQRVVDIFSSQFALSNISVVEVNKRLDEMIEVLKRSLGRGQIRVTGVREGKDGTTLLELEVLRPPAYVR